MAPARFPWEKLRLGGRGLAAAATHAGTKRERRREARSEGQR